MGIHVNVGPCLPYETFIKRDSACAKIHKADFLTMMLLVIVIKELYSANLLLCI